MSDYLKVSIVLVSVVIAHINSPASEDDMARVVPVPNGSVNGSWVWYWPEYHLAMMNTSCNAHDRNASYNCVIDDTHWAFPPQDIVAMNLANGLAHMKQDTSWNCAGNLDRRRDSRCDDSRILVLGGCLGIGYTAVAVSKSGKNAFVGCARSDALSIIPMEEMVAMRHAVKLCERRTGSDCEVLVVHEHAKQPHEDPTQDLATNPKWPKTVHNLSCNTPAKPKRPLSRDEEEEYGFKWYGGCIGL